MKKNKRLSERQVEMLLNLADNPLNLDNTEIKSLLEESVVEHMVNGKRKLEIVAETGVLRDDLDLYLDTVEGIYEGITNNSFPKKMTRGAMSQDSFGVIQRIANVDKDMINELQDLFVEGKKIEILSDTKLEMLKCSDAFKQVTHLRDLFLADENHKDNVTIDPNQIERKQENIMEF